MEIKKVQRTASSSGIGAYFQLETINVRPDDILLDPRNPRLAIESDDFDGLSEKDLVKEQVQKAVLRQIEKKPHHVKDLEDSIRAKGFIDGLGSFIIKKVPGNERYLVLEGNRRTAAIKRLLRYHEELSPNVKKSLNTISVYHFVYKKNNKYSEEQIIEMLLGIIHLQGPLPWGPLEKARYIYQAYMREYAETNDKKSFIYNLSVVDRLCKLFPISNPEVRKNLRIYVVYRQLLAAGYDVDPDRYSLIEIASNDKTLRKKYFEVNGTTLRFTDVGLERIYNLCIRLNRPINDPKTFRKFKEIYKYGDGSYVQEIEDGISTVKETSEHIQGDIKQGKLSDQLESILIKIRKINVGSISNADDDCFDLIESIVEVVNNRLAPLVGYENEYSNGNDTQNEIELPNNINDALNMPDVHLKPIITEVLRERPNKSCVKDKLPKYVLDYMEILTRGEPRRWFNKKIEDVVKEMVHEGILNEYTATNIRIKLMV